MNPIDTLLKYAGTVVLAGGSLSLIVYQVFKHLASKWLDSKFDEQLQSLKHEQSKEIEALRFKIAAMLDRASKLNQREFEILPEAWTKLNEAYWAAKAIIASLQFFPDLARMSSPELDEFLAGSNLLDSEKVKLRNSSEMNHYYQDCIGWRRLVEAETKVRESARFLATNGIFISRPIRGKFDAINDLVWKALVEHRINQDEQMRPRMQEDLKSFMKNGDGLLKELDAAVQERLWVDESRTL